MNILTGLPAEVVYRDLIEKIDYFQKMFTLAICITIVGCAFSAPLPYTIFRYFILDMGENSFQLFARAWFVPIRKSIR